MSFLLTQEIPCTYCQFPNTVEVWSVINVKDDPELKELILGGEMNMAECQSCRKVFYAENFLVYHDPDNELMAFVYPYKDQDRRAEFEEKTRVDYEKFQFEKTTPEPNLYSALTLFGLDELVRLLEEEDEMGLQGEIIHVLARDHALDVKILRASEGRRQKLPMVLPYTRGEKSFREGLLKALDRIVKLNDRLTVYSQLQKTLQAQPSLEVEFE